MKIAVVDDSDMDRKQLISYIKSSSCALNCDTEVVAYSLGENFLEDEDLSLVDAVFLDIYMGQKNGLEVAKALRDNAYHGIIIFCTTTPHFALEGYSVKAMNYIVKPFTYEKIAQQMKDIQSALRENDRFVRVKDGRQWCKVNLSDILFVENQGNYVRVHTFQKTHSMRTALREMETQLLAYGCFVKCDRGIIVNLENIKEVQGNTILLFELELRERLDKNPNTKYVVCQFDIENFKILNEICGFEAGDRIICQLADELRGMAIPELDAYARITSDGFIILKSYTSMEANRKLLRASEHRIREMANQEFNCVVTLKFGMYYLEDNAESTASILEKANYAHSICKLNPTINRYLYDEADKQSAIEEKRIEARMEEALAQEQFLLYLQPKFRLTDESLAGAEALVRWRVGENGEMVYPNSFIPLFEKNGFITKLDMYMLELVCKLISGWIAAGENPTVVSINFSRLHLLNPRFTQQICEMVDRYQVPRKFIEIELTETTMFDNEEAMFTVLQSLHEDGFTLSMDDFGTGYSSLGLLKNLPVDVIKIDRSFFLNSRFKTRAKAVIENVLQMARRLEIHTVAEGVETQDDIDMLREMGCEIVQGYYFSRPVPVAEFRLDGTIQSNRLPHMDPRVEVAELGDLALGRIHIGEMTSVLAYRLLQMSLRKTLSDMYGDGEMIFALRNTGKVAGCMFAREFLDLSLPFDDFLLMLAAKLDELKIGQLSVERLDLEQCGAVIKMADDLDCSGIGVCDQTLCQYDEGFLAGIMKEYTQKNYSVTETDCWGTGASFCRFEIKLT